MYRSRLQLAAPIGQLPFTALPLDPCPPKSVVPIGLSLAGALPLPPCPLYFPFLSLGLSLHRARCPSASHHSVSFLFFLLAQSFPLYFPFLSLGRLCQRSPRTFPISLLCVESTGRNATTLAVGQVRPSSHPKPAVRGLSPTAAFGPWDVQLRGPFSDITTFCLPIPVLSPPCGERIMCPGGGLWHDALVWFVLVGSWRRQLADRHLLPFP